VCILLSPCRVSWGGTLMLQVPLHSTHEAVSHLPSRTGVEGMTRDRITAFCHLQLHFFSRNSSNGFFEWWGSGLMQECSQSTLKLRIKNFRNFMTRRRSIQLVAAVTHSLWTCSRGLTWSKSPHRCWSATTYDILV
jgi:hypothetical protein